MEQPPFELSKPIVFFDLEATGISPWQDRIVDIALIKLLPDGSEETFSSLVNPEISIPPETTQIHHITDQMVASAPLFRDIAVKVLNFIGDGDLAGFGLAKYDVPMLQAEFKRAGMMFPLEGRAILDSLIIFRKMERRDLTAAYKFFCGKDLAGAHRAEADARASAEVFWGQIARYPSLPKNIKALAEFCNERDASHVDGEGKFIWRNGEAVFNFGKHRTVALREIARTDPSYIHWLTGAEKTTPELAKICTEALAGRFPVKPANG